MPITDPTGITGCQLWYKYKDWYTDAGATPVSAVAQAVQQWNDSSGNARHATQATSGNRPVTMPDTGGGFGCLRFTRGNSQALGADWGWMVSSPVTLLVVAKRVSDQGGNLDFWAGASTPGTGGGSLCTGYRNNTTPTVALWGNDLDGSITNDTSLARTVYLAMWGGPGNRVIEWNQTQIASDTQTAQLNNLANAQASRIGMAAGSYFDGYIYEVIAYNKQLSSTEKSDLYTWISGRSYAAPATFIRETAAFAGVGQPIAAPNPHARETAAFAGVGQLIAAPGSPPIHDRETAAFAAVAQLIAAPGTPPIHARETAAWASVAQIIGVPTLRRRRAWAQIID